MKHTMIKSCLLTAAITSLTFTTVSFADTAPPPVVSKPGSIATALSTGNMIALITDLFEIPRSQYLPTLSQGVKQNASQQAVESTPTIPLQTANDVRYYVYTSVANSLPAGNSNLPFVGQAKTNPLLPTRLSGSSLAHLLPLVNSDNAYNVASQNLNGAVLLGSDVLQTPAQQSITSNLIQFLGDVGDRVTPLGLQTLKQAQGPVVISYLNNIGSYFAGQSVGLSVLYTLANERMPLNGYKDQSALTVEKQNDTWRMQPSYSKQVATMTPVDLMREQVMMQAQMLNEMYAMKQQIEMLNFTIATMQLEAQQTVAKPLLQGKQQQIIQTAQSNTSNG